MTVQPREFLYVLSGLHSKQLAEPHQNHLDEPMLSLLRDCYVLVSKHDLSLMAGGVAFFAILSIFPALAAFVAIFGIFAEPILVQQQIVALDDVLPSEVISVLEQQAIAIVDADNSILTWTTVVSLGFTLWTARRGIGALQRGIFLIGHGRPPSGIKATFLALVLTLIFMVAGFLAVIVIVGLPVVWAFVPVPVNWHMAIEISRWGIVLSVMLFAIVALYRLGYPNKGDTKKLGVLPGAILSIVLWFLVSRGFSAYLYSFGSYDRIYGSIGVVIAMLMWLYLSAYIVFIGFVLNVVVSEKNHL